jgi:hypothetical protein
MGLLKGIAEWPLLSPFFYCVALFLNDKDGVGVIYLNTRRYNLCYLRTLETVSP